mmetsp:Transcript_3389/g.7001  ORF Transcript_3389/g.7001 Transcript_3389/m.7001 type:complete len:385 (+) Transcript_3389:3933-5087(+)
MDDSTSNVSLFSFDYFSVKRPCLSKATLLTVPTPSLTYKLTIEDSTSDSESSTSTGFPDTPEVPSGSTKDFPQKQTPKKLDYYKMARSKQGSKRLQKIIAKGETDDIERIVVQVAPAMAELMTDKFGNYMCQALFENCSASQRVSILKCLRPSLLKIAKHPVGTHSLQSLVELATLPQEGAIYEAVFKPHVVSLAKHTHASHVLQVLASTLINRDFIAIEVASQAKELASHQLGLCVVKKCMFSRELVQALLPHSLALSQDAYGNYAMQELLDNWGLEFHMAVGYHLMPQITKLATHKFASNVVEKCIKYSALGHVLARTLIEAPNIGGLLSNMYGCYVLKAIAEQIPSLQPVLIERAKEAATLLSASKRKARHEQIALILGEA